MNVTMNEHQRRNGFSVAAFTAPEIRSARGKIAIRALDMFFILYFMIVATKGAFLDA